MGAPPADNALERALKRVPLPVRVATLLGWVAVVFYVRWQDTEEHSVAPWLWAVEIAGFLFLAVRGAPRIVAALRAPDRARFEFSRAWIGFFLGIVCCLVLGPALVFDREDRAPLVGIPVFVVGVLAAGLFFRYITKPARPEVRSDPVADWLRREPDESWRVGAGWYPSPKPDDDRSPGR